MACRQTGFAMFCSGSVQGGYMDLSAVPYLASIEDINCHSSTSSMVSVHHTEVS